MGAFDSIRMGYKCKAWLLEADASSALNSCGSRGPNYEDNQWIVNAVTGGQAEIVKRESETVLDGGPRWVLSTALGFLTRNIWGTVIIVLLVAISNYAVYVNTASSSSSVTSSDEAVTSSGEVAGVVTYMILATALSMASVPGVRVGADVLYWKQYACGLAVEMCLCFSVLLSAGILHRFFEPFLVHNAGLAIYIDAGRWVTPGLVWLAGSKLRQQATSAVQTKLRGLWCFHPAQRSHQRNDRLWDDWSVRVKECASRVGGFSMLGFTADDLGKLRSCSPSQNALEVINIMISTISINKALTEPWIKQSLAFLFGYDDRLRHGCPESDKSTIPLKNVKTVIRELLSGRHADVDAFQMKIDNDRGHKEKYGVTVEAANWQFYYAGALIADSDQREEKIKQGEHGSRLAVSLASFAEGTDPLARLDCFAESKVPESDVWRLSKAISSSTKALITGLARSANVDVIGNPLGERGLAYAKVKRLEYSPDEIVAASHLDEAVVICDDTFTAGTPTAVLEKLWGESESVEKRVDVSDMVPSTGSGSELGASACRGWLVHVGFTFAILAVYFFEQPNTAFTVLFLTAIPARSKEVSAHMQNHFYMVYISYILNYIRFGSRVISLSPRGEASVDKAKRVHYVVFLFVNVLPTLASTGEWSGWKWWVAFVPCLMANVPGLFNTFRYGWNSAFEYKWWSWHILNRWYSCRSYLKIGGLRRRVGRNVLSVNVEDYSDPALVKKVLPLHDSGVRFMVIGGR